MYHTKIKSICLKKALPKAYDRDIYLSLLKKLNINLKKDLTGNYVVNEMVAYYAAFKFGSRSRHFSINAVVCYKVFNEFVDDENKIKIPDFDNIGKGKLC